MIKLSLAGDVMTGRGIDQILPHPSAPELHEPCVGDARTYVELAEQRCGEIPQPADFRYVWGDALEILERAAPDLRIVNLETSVTRSDEYWPGKGIHYRMHPRNVGCLVAAAIDCCVLANNHVLDWGYAGLAETISTLRGAGIQTAGAGSNVAAAEAPAIFDLSPRGRVLVFSTGSSTSGIPREWAAGSRKPGVNYAADLSPAVAEEIGRAIDAYRRNGDVVVVSIHWGPNWGYPVAEQHRRFARELIECGADVIHGHSSHHARGIELYRNRPIIYGCGDLLNDYEGISGHEAYRDDLAVLYFVGLDGSSGRLAGLEMTVLKIHAFSLQEASEPDASRLAAVLDREGRGLGTRVSDVAGNVLRLEWPG